MCVAGWQQMGLAGGVFFSFSERAKDGSCWERESKSLLFSKTSEEETWNFFFRREWKTFHPHTLHEHSNRFAPLSFIQPNYVQPSQQHNAARTKRYMHIWVSPQFTFVKVIRWICSFSSCSSLALYFNHLVTIMAKREKALCSLYAKYILSSRTFQSRLAKVSHFFSMINERPD